MSIFQNAFCEDTFFKIFKKDFGRKIHGYFVKKFQRKFSIT